MLGTFTRLIILTFKKPSSYSGKHLKCVSTNFSEHHGKTFLGNWWEDENWEGRAHFSEKRSDCQRGIPGHPDAGFPKLQDQFARASNIFTLKESSTPCKYFTTFSFCPWLDLTPPPLQKKGVWSGLSQWIGWPTTSLGWRHFFYASNPFEPSNKSPICTTHTV